MINRRTRHRIESVLVHLFMIAFRLMPLDAASWLGGKLGEWIGPRTGIDRKARKQMVTILPDLSARDVDTHIRTMWNNLGRTMAEYPHLPRIMRERVGTDDRAGITQDPDFATRPAIFISGHFANWEVAGPALLHFTGQKLNLLYRSANNAGVDRLLNTYRSMNGALDTLAKSHAGTRALVECLRLGQKVGILVDQKYSEGIVTDFFGRPATATTIYAQLGQKFDCPVYPAQIIRTGGAHFKIILYPALALWTEDGTPRAFQDVVHDVHTMMFDWVREHPGQWLWVHQRWSSPRLRDTVAA